MNSNNYSIVMQDEAAEVIAIMLHEMKDTLSREQIEALEIAWTVLHDIPDYAVKLEDARAAMLRETGIRRESYKYNVVLRTLRRLCEENEIFTQDVEDE